MKKIWRAFTFWGVVISLVEIYMHQVGQDSFSIVLIGLNPLLGRLCSWEAGVLFMNSGKQIVCNTVAGDISIYWYIGSLITWALYGGIIDGIRWGWQRLRL